MADTLPKPDYDATKNMRLVGYSDQDGRCDGVQIMVHRGYAYIGHIFSKGFSVIDVRDPAHPKYVKHVAAPSMSWTLHMQATTTSSWSSTTRTVRPGRGSSSSKAYYKALVHHHAKARGRRRATCPGMARLRHRQARRAPRSASCWSRET